MFSEPNLLATESCQRQIRDPEIAATVHGVLPLGPGRVLSSVDAECAATPKPSPQGTPEDPHADVRIHTALELPEPAREV
jgi:hypothetical protein